MRFLPARDRRMRGLLAILWLGASCACAQEGPQPRYVDPGKPGRPPSDAIVLFDGKNLSEWVHNDGSPAKWPVDGGVMTCKSGTGDIHTKRKVGSAQIHVEF